MSTISQTIKLFDLATDGYAFLWDQTTAHPTPPFMVRSIALEIESTRAKTSGRAASDIKDSLWLRITTERTARLGSDVTDTLLFAGRFDRICELARALCLTALAEPSAVITCSSVHVTGYSLGHEPVSEAFPSGPLDSFANLVRTRRGVCLSIRQIAKQHGDARDLSKLEFPTDEAAAGAIADRFHDWLERRNSERHSEAAPPGGDPSKTWR